MLVGYLLRGDDNGGFMLPEDTEGLVCPACGRKTDPDYIDPTFRVKRRRYEFSVTYDGYDIASRRFKEFCEARAWEGIEFVALPGDPDFFWMRVENVLEVHPEHGNVEREKFCRQCGVYASIFGGPMCLKGIVSPLPDGFYRTDVEFASGINQHPLIILGLEAGEAIEAQRFRGTAVRKINACPECLAG